MKIIAAITRRNLQRLLGRILIVSPVIFMLLGSSAMSISSAQTTTGPFNPNLPTLEGIVNLTIYGVVQDITPLNPTGCLTLVAREGLVNASGIIQSNAPGTSDNHQIMDACVTPNIGSGQPVWTFNDVSIAGRTGSITLVNTPTYIGLPTFANGTAIAGPFSIVSSSGGLAGLTGEGMGATGMSSATGSSGANWIRMQFNNTISIINVNTVNSNHQAIIGYWTTLWQNGKQLASCFSPCQFAVNNGQTYQVIAANFGPEQLAHWQDGTTPNPLINVVVPNTSTTIALTATYTP